MLSQILTFVVICPFVHIRYLEQSNGSADTSFSTQFIPYPLSSGGGGAGGCGPGRLGVKTGLSGGEGQAPFRQFFDSVSVACEALNLNVTLP